MKRYNYWLVAAFCLLFAGSSTAQKRMALVEHFTNSKCPICKANNPGFYSRFEKYSNDAIHIAYHPSVPYNSCIFYVANKDGNGARQSFYEIIGTPTAFVNGRKGTSSLPSDADYLNAINQPAEYDITITSAAPGNVELKITPLKSLPSGAQLRLFTALIENKVLYDAPNGETEHPNVFRKFLGDQNQGIVVSFPEGTAANSSKSVSLGAIDYSGVTDWSKFSIIAFINLDGQKEILQAAKQSVGALSETNVVEHIPTCIFPNPSRDAVRISWADTAPRDIEIKIFDMQGNLRSVIKPDAGRSFIEINTSGYIPGAYIYHMIGPEKKLLSNGKFILQ